MEHNMRLHKEPFERIQKGTKTAEFRLNDKKRQQIKIDDIINFKLRPDFVQIIQARVTGLSYFSTFKDCFNQLSVLTPGYNPNQNIEAMKQYYSEEQEKKYGIVVIHFELIK